LLGVPLPLVRDTESAPWPTPCRWLKQRRMGKKREEKKKGREEKKEREEGGNA